MYKAEFPALGTTWWIKIFDDSDKPDQIIESARSLVLDFEQNYSRFRQDSLVGRLNAGETLTSYPDELREMLEFAQQTEATAPAQRKQIELFSSSQILDNKLCLVSKCK